MTLSYILASLMETVATDTEDSFIAAIKTQPISDRGPVTLLPYISVYPHNITQGFTALKSNAPGTRLPDSTLDVADNGPIALINGKIPKQR